MTQNEQLTQWIHSVDICQACALSAENNRGATRSSGPVTSPLLIVGEGPGGVEDIYGVPLVGPSGQLLDKALWSVGVTRDNVYVTNIVKCRPKANRTPSDEAALFCGQKHLLQEIQIVKPKVIIALGKVALHFFNNGQGKITALRGQWLSWQNIPVMPTFHPAYLLRQTGQQLVDAKWQVYYDLKAAVEKVKELSPEATLQSSAIPNLLLHYDFLKKKRQYKITSTSK